MEQPAASDASPPVPNALQSLAFHDQSPIAISIIDTTGRQLQANRAFRELFGMDESVDLDTISAGSLTHPDDRADVDRYLSSLISGEVDDLVLEKRYLRVDGTEFWGRLRARPIPNASGEVACLMGAITEITLERNAMRALFDADLARAQREHRVIDGATATFVASVGHELRAPLHAILGLAELLTQSALEDEDHRLAAAIHREASTLRLLVDDLLDFSKIEAGRLKINSDVFSPSRLMVELADLVRREADDKGLGVVVEIDPTTPARATADSLRVRQILVNLASNAVRYTERGELRFVVSAPNSTQLDFSVVDTGIGIDESVLPSLFEVFTQVGDGRIGTGLGLAISHQLATLLGGTLDASSTLGKGSMFTLHLPLQATPVATTEEPAEVGVAPAHGHILVAEDGEVNQLLVKSQLTKLGYDCTIAENGLLAAQAAAEGSFDAILMDWHMPEADGLEATRLIRRAETTSQHVPIIAVTASAMQGNRELCLAAGMDDFLSKPVSIEDLRSTLAKWVVAPGADPDDATPILDDDPIDPCAPGTRDSPLVDRATLEVLAEDLGDPAVVATIVHTFLDELDDRIALIDQCHAATTDPAIADQVMRAAHTLKSTSALLGATVLSQRCDDLQNMIKRSASEAVGVAPPQAIGLSAQILELSALVANELTEYLATSAPLLGPESGQSPA